MDEIKAKKIFNEAQKNFESLKYEKARELWFQILEFYPEKPISIKKHIFNLFQSRKFL